MLYIITEKIIIIYYEFGSGDELNIHVTKAKKRD